MDVTQLLMMMGHGTKVVVKTKTKKEPGCFRIFLDFILTICTGGLWLIWLLIRYLRRKG